VLHRQIAQVRHEPADQAWFAALSALVPALAGDVRGGLVRVQDGPADPATRAAALASREAIQPVETPAPVTSAINRAARSIGGWTGTNAFNDTWAYATLSRRWTASAPTGTPGGRWGASMVYDPANGKVILSMLATGRGGPSRRDPRRHLTAPDLSDPAHASLRVAGMSGQSHGRRHWFKEMSNPDARLAGPVRAKKAVYLAS
jgi:hypothetical protein